jgi:hypothetical protein
VVVEVDQIMVLEQVELVEPVAVEQVDRIHHLHPQQQQEQPILEEAAVVVDNLLVHKAVQEL